VIGRFGCTTCAALLALAVMAGCATRLDRADAPPPATSLLVTYETQVAIGPCVFEPPRREAKFLADIATALASSAITQGVNYLAKALDEAAKATNDRATASRNVEVTTQSFGPCLQVARGWFFRGFEDAVEQARQLELASRTWGASGAVDPSKLAMLWRRRLWLAAQPDFVFEARILASELQARGKTHVLTLVPVYARLDAPISKALLRPSTSRDVAVFFAFHEATSDPSAPSNGSGGLALGRLDAGVDVLFPPPDVSTDETPNRSAAESRWFTVALTADKKPMTITTLVTEHQDASEFLAFLADVLGGAHGDVSEALQTALIPSLQAQAEESGATKLDALETAYEESLSRALSAATSCASKVGDALDVASDVRARVRAVNRTARALGKPQIAALVPLSADAAAVQAGCAQLREALLRELQRR
jgi:hypothetical protein